MKKLTIDMNKCEYVNGQNCTLCPIRVPGLLEMVKRKGFVMISEWAENPRVAELVEDCPCNAMSLSEGVL